MSFSAQHSYLADLIAGRSRRINWKRNLFIVWLGQILAMCATSFALPFVPLYIREKFGIDDEAQRGVYVAAFQFFGMMSFCVSNPIWGMLGDRCGRKLMLLRAYFLNGITMPLLMVAPNIYWLIFFRMLVSCFSGTISAAQALVISTTPENKHGFALGVLSTALWSGSVLGLLGGGIVVHYFSYTAAFLSCGAIFILGGFLMLFGVSENFVPPPAEVKAVRRRKPSLKKLFAPGLFMLLVLLLCLALARRLDEPFLPMLVEKISGPQKAVLYTSYICALAAIGGILAGVIIGALSDRYPAWAIALPALLIAGAGTIVQACAGSIGVLAVARFFTFLTVGAIEPVVLAMVSRVTPPDHRGAALGWSASARVLGSVIGAAVSGGIVKFFMTRGVFFTGGVLLIALAPFAVLLLRNPRCAVSGKSGK